MAIQWDDVRIFLEVVREASITGGSEKLGMHQSTVSRRIKALEDDVGCPLVRRGSQGVSLTTNGKKLWEMAESMGEVVQDIEDHFHSIRKAPKGVVRVTTVEEIAVQFIVPGLPEFRRRWPEVEIKLVTMPQLLDLNKGEADVSIRLFRPEKGDLHATKLGEFGYAVFGTEAYVSQLPKGWESRLEDLDWIFLEADNYKVPEWAVMDEQMPHIKPVLRCNSFKTLIATVQAGLGVGIFPKGMTYFYPDLQRFHANFRIPKSELWMCVADERRDSAAVQAVCKFLANAIQKAIKKMHFELMVSRNLEG